MGTIRPKRISEFKPLFTNLAQTSHYQLIFGGLPTPLTNYLTRRGVTLPFITENAGLLCFNAVLPTTSFASKTIDGNFTGIFENFATARMYTEISLDFYVDINYQQIKFLESWMEFIASGSHNPLGSNLPAVNQSNANYFIRMQYPQDYKCNYTKIIKFDRDYNKEIQYTFIGLWPSMMSQPAVSYSNSDIMKVSATFKFDRYIAGSPLSIDNYLGTSNNQQSNQPLPQPGSAQSGLTPISPGASGGNGVGLYSGDRTEAIVQGRIIRQ